MYRSEKAETGYLFKPRNIDQYSIDQKTGLKRIEYKR